MESYELPDFKTSRLPDLPFAFSYVLSFIQTIFENKIIFRERPCRN